VLAGYMQIVLPYPKSITFTWRDARLPCLGLAFSR